MSLLELKNRNWIKEQIKLQIDRSNMSTGSFDALVLYRKEVQIIEHFNWLVWAVATYYFNRMAETEVTNVGLPDPDNKKWFEGFVWRGVYFKLLPYEEAYYIRNEI